LIAGWQIANRKHPVDCPDPIMLCHITRHLDRRFWLYAALIAALSLWLRDGTPIWAITDAGHDDQLFLRHASSILKGDWLGHYDRLTHAKPPFYSLFIALAFLISIPLKLAEHIAYLAAGFALAAYIGHRAGCRVTMLGSFALIAFCPVLWHPELQRVIREGIYMPQTLAILALGAHCFLTTARKGWRNWLVLALFGLLFASFWVTREEGIWLIPSLLLLMIAGVVIGWVEQGRTKPVLLAQARRQAAQAGVFVIVAVIGVASIGALNWRVYDSFRINDFQTRDFAAAYGAIVRVSDPEPKPLVPASRSKLELIYNASPAAAEMAPHMSGKVGEFWGQVGCDARPVEGCEEILSGWFQWAIRDAAADAGHYSSATEASRYFERLAAEINAACGDGTLECGPQQNSMTPKFKSELLGPLMTAIWEGTVLTLKQRDGRFGSLPASGHPNNRSLFADMTGHAIQPWSDPNNAEAKRPRSDEFNNLRITIARWLTNAQRVVTGLALIAAVLGTLFVLLKRERIRRLNWRLVALTLAIGGAIDARIVLLAYVHVTAQPAINPLYFSPGIVLVPALAACWLAMLIPVFRKQTAETTGIAETAAP